MLSERVKYISDLYSESIISYRIAPSGGFAVGDADLVNVPDAVVAEVSHAVHGVAVFMDGGV